MNTITVGYCGICCGTCVHATVDREGCSGCRNRGGAKDCYQRSCCVAKGIEGCWQCEDFPCSNGFFGDDAWKGFCIGCSEIIKELGIHKYFKLVREKLGECVEISKYRFKTAQDIATILRGNL